MTLGAAALAIIALAILFFRGGGGRVAIAVAAMAGSLIGFVGVIAIAFFGGIERIGGAILSALQ